MKIRSMAGSMMGLCLLASCAGGAREVGQQAVQTQRNTSAGGDLQGATVITATGASGGSVNRPVTMGRDDAPTLVTLQGRAPSQPTNTAPTIATSASPSREVPAEGGYIVRRAGSAGGGVAAGSGAGELASVRREPTVTGDTTRVSTPRNAGTVGAPRPMAQSTPTSVDRDRRAATTATSSPRASAGGRGGGGGGASAGAARMDDGASGVMATRAMTEAEAPAPRDEAPRVMPVGGAIARPTPVIPPGSTVTVTTTVAVTPPMIVEEQQEPAGLLTAATVGDVDRYASYMDYLARHTSEAGELRLDMTRRLRIRVVDAQGRGVNAARVRLSNQGGTVEALTHADGSYDYFPGLSTAQLAGVARLDVQVESLSVGADVQIPTQGDGQPVVVRLNAAVQPPQPVLDLGFVIDVTGSMGDELRYVNREIASIVQRVERESPGVRVRLSATFYRDRVDEAVVQQIPFTTNVQGFSAAMQNVYASGGGDYPEDMSAGLDAALNRLAWSEGAAVRVLVLVADAPPQHYGDSNFTYREAMVRAAQRGIRILPVAASGSDRRVEFLFRAMGAYTSTPYVYLTDDSGVGGSHMEADTDRVAVERFNDALVRLVSSDLRGQGMHEPGRLGAERN